QLGEKGAVADLLERADLRQHFRLLPADELRFEACVAGEVTRALELALLASGTRDLAMLLHQPLEAVLVDDEPPLARELDGQLDREAVRRREREGVLAGDLAARRDVLEELHAPGERLGEAFLLRSQRVADGFAIRLELRIPLAHLLDDDVGDAPAVFEPDLPRLLDRAADDPAEHVAPPLVGRHDAVA